MKIVVLAAGLGSRLQPHTNNLPKALVPLAGKPLLEYQLKVFKQLGLTDISIVAGYLFDKFDDYGLNVILNMQYKSSNMVYSLMCAQELMSGAEDLIIAYGDIIYQADVLQNLIETQGDIVISADKNWHALWQLRMENPYDDAESFKYSPDSNTVIELGKKINSSEDAQAQYIGLIKFSSASFTRIVKEYELLGIEKTKNMYLTDFLQHLITQKLNVVGSIHDRGWLEVDTVGDLQCYQEMFDEAQFTKLGFIPN